VDRRALATAGLTAAALVAFAANSILCRLALGARRIDALTFTNIRLVSGALALAAIVLATRRAVPLERGSWLSALALFFYAAPFSLAYLSLPAGIGALILFGAVQTTMIGWGLWRGERPHALEILGLVLAICGLAGLALPGASAPEPWAAGSMAVAGVAWGVYSLRGRGAADPLASTAGNFARTVLFCAPLAVFAHEGANVSSDGVVLAVASGALASGIGYAIW
jgi:drug/metabolite transporter (DMT)-like permease